MRLHLYSWLAQLCDFLMADLHRTERHLQAVRVWLWLQCSKQNLRSINSRSVRERLS